MPEPSVFLSYRRSDSGGHSGRLYDALRRRLGRDNVFMDVDSIAAGDDWMAAIDRRIRRSDALLAVIGTDWLTAADAKGGRRIDDPRDPLRLEIETALAADKTIIPILVGGAQMPAADTLPELLRALARRNSIRLDNETFDADLRGLLAAIRGLSGRVAEGQSLTLTFLFTDIVGSTELLQRLGEEKSQTLFKRHHEALAKAVADHAGTELEWLGDGMVASFASSAEAIRCALAMQRSTRRQSGSQAVSMRIGVHTGEAMRREGGFFGNTVVIARRLCDRAAAGQVLTSGFVASMLGGRALEFRSLGPLELKGIATPVDAFEVVDSRAPKTGTVAPVALPVPAATPAAEVMTGRAKPPRTLPTWAPWAGAVAFVALAVVAAVALLPGLFGSTTPTGRAPLVNNGTGIVSFDVGESECATSRNCLIFVLDAVSDPDGDPVTIVAVGPSSQGATLSVTTNRGRQVAHWLAPAGFVATSDSFEFTVSDNHHNVVRGTCEVVNIPTP